MPHLYVHVPFCQRRCSYCDFSIAVRKQFRARAYVDAVLGELAAVCPADSGREPGDVGGESLDTLYLGAGTPSLLPPDAISALLTSLLDVFRATPSRDVFEVTLEANPEDVTPDSARAWRRAGINRVSLGAQSFDNRVLQWMHRSHDATRIGDAVRTLRAAGVANPCRDGLRPRDNSACWSGRAYLGLGPAAHSFDGRVRRWNLPTWEAYRRAVAARRPVVEAEEVLTDEQRDLESLYLALRTAAGMPLAALGRPLPPAAARWVERGWAEIRGQRLVCTPEGWLRLDALVGDLTNPGGAV